MSRPAAPALITDYPAPSVVLELLKPITWFPPMWAFGCGVVSAGTAFAGRWPVIAAGVVLCGPLLCATSQAVNDWFDRHVDAINEPLRPIPSGRMPGRWGLYVAILWSCLSLLLAATLGFAGLGQVFERLQRPGIFHRGSREPALAIRKVAHPLRGPLIHEFAVPVR